jgi:outer membrane usher protein
VDVQHALPTSIQSFFLTLALACTAIAWRAPPVLGGEPIDGGAADAAGPSEPDVRSPLWDAGQAKDHGPAERLADGIRLDRSAPPGGKIASTSAETDALSAGDEDRPAFLHTTVNQIDIGDLLVLLRGADILVRVQDLEKSGMRIESGWREKRSDGEQVSLRSLAPKLTFSWSEVELSLTITAHASMFGAVALDLRAKRPEGIVYASSPSLFVNYRVQAADLQDKTNTYLSAVNEAGLSYRGLLLYSTASYAGRSSNSYDRLFYNASWVRGLTNLSYDWRAQLVRIVAGDVTVNSGDVLGGGGYFAGVGASRAFALDPYFVFLPSMQLSGTALTPSTVEVYVNGQMIKREALPPGQFNLQNVPLTNGSGETRVVVRDAFGGQQTMVNPYYLALGTLAKGLSDFSYDLGFFRRNLTTQSWSYGQAAFALRHRRGIADWLTVGARIEGTRDMLSGGASMATRLTFGRLSLGEVGLTVAGSRRSGESGLAGLVSYSYVGKPTLAQIGMRFATDRYSNLSLAPETDRQLLDINATAAMTLNKVASISLQLQHGLMRDSGRTDSVAFRINRSILRWLYAFGELDNIYSSSRPVELRTFFGLTFSVAERTTAAVSRGDRWASDGTHGRATQGTLQQSLPVGSGLGYRLALVEGENDVNDGLLQYQGQYGRLEAEYQHPTWRASERGHASVSAAGGVVLIGGRAYLTRPMQDAFALVRVPGVGGVHGLVSNQVVGTTDHKGDLLVPSLLSYYGNRIGIDDKDIPLDHDIGATEMTIAPPYRSGAIVTFPVRQVLAVAGTVVVVEKGRDLAPAYGQLVVNAGEKRVVSPFDEAGNFYLEDLAPGSYAAEAQYEGGTCTFQLHVQPGPTALVQVGNIKCIVDRKDSE